MPLIIPSVSVVLPVDAAGAAVVRVGAGAQVLVELEDMDTSRAVAVGEAMRQLLKKFIQLNHLDGEGVVVIEVEAYIDQFAPPPEQDPR